MATNHDVRAVMAVEPEFETNDAVEQFLLRCEPECPSASERLRRLRSKLIRYFQSRYCDDPESLTDETLMRVVDNILARKPIENPQAYVRGVALNVYKEYVRYAIRRRSFNVDMETAADEEKWINGKDKGGECFQHCLSTLPDDKRSLIEQYYSEPDHREEQAAGIGVTLAALRIRVHRIKAELKKCYLDCIGRSGSDSKRN